jgi:hypothetical protein
MHVFKGKSYTSRVSRTHCVPGLLAENLSQGDHLTTVLEFFGEIDHLVGCILLSARSRGGQKGSERNDRNIIALSCASRGDLDPIGLVWGATSYFKRVHKQFATSGWTRR